MSALLYGDSRSIQWVYGGLTPIEELNMANVSMRDMLKAGVHFELTRTFLWILVHRKSLQLLQRSTLLILKHTYTVTAYRGVCVALVR